MLVKFRIGMCFIGILSFALNVSAKQTSSSPYSKLDVFGKVLGLIENNHVEEIDEDALITGAIKGLLRSLDPHSAYLTPNEFKMLQEDTEGNFCGVGMEVGIKENILTVIAPIPNSPAIKAGILPGDKIIRIQGKSTENMDIEQSVQLMRGKEGTNVRITISRQGVEKPFKVTLTRAVIEMQSVESQLISPGFIHIKVKAFQDGTSIKVKEHIKRMELLGGGLFGVILDLRRNPGGLMYEAVKVSDLFLADGAIMSTKGRRDVVIESFDAHRPGTFDKVELVVLIDGASASASEIVAGALQDNGRAMIVGMRSFGKGSVQTIIPLKSGAGLKLTTARYYTPSGRSIQATGIEPDVVVESLSAPKMDELTQTISEMPHEGDLEGHLDREADIEQQGVEHLFKDDYQLKMSYQILKGLYTKKVIRKEK